MLKLNNNLVSMDYVIKVYVFLVENSLEYLELIFI